MKRVFSIQHGLVATLIALVVIFSIPFSKVRAQANPLAVPVDCGISLTCIQNNWKTFVGDRLAVMITNQIIQRMTASVVNWINTGFEGSPSFITRPEAFFADVGDQITGELIQKSGATSLLCSPFSFNIRLNLALNQVGSMNKRYECTLSTAISNAQNSVQNNVFRNGIQVNSTADGVTLGNFMNGDFSQGGWPGFLVYTTQPQNNPVGAWLMAKSDLDEAIAKKKASVNQDLNRGQGFLSWPKCTDVTSDYTDITSAYGEEPGAADAIGNKFGLKPSEVKNLETKGFGSTGSNELGKSTGIRKVTKDGVTTYQNCSVQTPGSMIASSLFNQADTGREKLVSVKTISDSIDAITGALVNQMLTQGLAALSSHGSGSGGSSRSYLSELYEESYNQNSIEAQGFRNRSQNTGNSIVNLAQDNINKYNDTISLLNSSKDKYLAARVCFTNKIAQLPQNQFAMDEQRAYGERMIGGIDLVITRNIDPMIASTSQKKVDAIVLLNNYQTNTASTTAIRGVTTNDIAYGFSRVESQVNTTLRVSQNALESSNGAQQAYQSTSNTVTNMLDKDADTFQAICNQYPYSGIQYQSKTFVNPLLAGLH